MRIKKNKILSLIRWFLLLPLVIKSYAKLKVQRSGIFISLFINLRTIRRISNTWLRNVKKQEMSLSRKGWYVNKRNYNVILIKLIYLTLAYSCFICCHIIYLKYSLAIIQGCSLRDLFDFWVCLKMVFIVYSNIIYIIMHIGFFICYITSIYHSITHDYNVKFVYITLSELGNMRTLPFREFYCELFCGSGLFPSDSTVGFWDYYLYLDNVFISHDTEILTKPATLTSSFFIVLNTIITAPVWLFMLVLFHPVTAVDTLGRNINRLKKLWDLPAIVSYLRNRAFFCEFELYIEHPSAKKTTKKVIFGIILLCVFLFGFMLPLAYSLEFTTASPHLSSVAYNWLVGRRRVHTLGYLAHIPNMPIAHLIGQLQEVDFSSYPSLRETTAEVEDFVQLTSSFDRSHFEFVERLDGSTEKKQYVHLIKKDSSEWKAALEQYESPTMKQHRNINENKRLYFEKQLKLGIINIKKGK